MGIANALESVGKSLGAIGKALHPVKLLPDRTELLKDIVDVGSFNKTAHNVRLLDTTVDVTNNAQDLHFEHPMRRMVDTESTFRDGSMYSGIGGSGVSSVKNPDHGYEHVSNLSVDSPHVAEGNNTTLSVDPIDPVTWEDNPVEQYTDTEQMHPNFDATDIYRVYSKNNLAYPKGFDEKIEAGNLDEDLSGDGTSIATATGNHASFASSSGSAHLEATKWFSEFRPELAELDNELDNSTSEGLKKTGMPKEVHKDFKDSEVAHLRDALKEDGVHEDYITPKIRDFIDPNISRESVANAKHTDFPKKYGLTNDVTNPMATVLDVVAHDDSTRFPKFLKDMARDFRSTIPGDAHTDFIPHTSGVVNSNSIMRRGTFNELLDAVDTMKNKELPDETRLKAIKKAVVELYKNHNAIVNTAGDALVKEAPAQTMLHKTPKDHFIGLFAEREETPLSKLPKKHEWLTQDLTAQGVVNQQLRKSGFTQPVAKVAPEQQNIAGLPNTYSATEQGIVPKEVAEMLEEPRMHAATQAKDSYERVKGLPELAKATKALRDFLNALWCISTLQAKNISLEYKRGGISDLIHNTVTGYQNTAKVGNTLYDNRLETPKGRNLYRDGIPKGKKGDKYLKEMLMPAVATPENVEYLKQFYSKYHIEDEHADHKLKVDIMRQIDGLANGNINHPEYSQDYTTLIRPVAPRFNADGTPTLDARNVLHLKVREYDKTIEELQCLPILKHLLGNEEPSTDKARTIARQMISRHIPITEIVGVLDNNKMLEEVKATLPDHAVQDLAELHKISSKLNPTMKAVVMKGTMGTPLNQTINNAEAVCGSVFMDGFGPQWRAGDLASMLINGGEIKRSDGAIPAAAGKHHIDAVLQAFDKLTSEHPELRKEIRDAKIGAVLNSEWAKQNVLKAPEDYKFTIKGIPNNGFTYSHMMQTRIPCDIRIPSIILEHVGLESENKGTGYAGKTTATGLFGDEVRGTANGLRKALIQSKLDPKVKGINALSTNKLRLKGLEDIGEEGEDDDIVGDDDGVDIGGVSSLHTPGGFQAKLYNDPNIMAPVTDSEMEHILPYNNIFTKAVINGDNHLDVSMIPRLLRDSPILQGDPQRIRAILNQEAYEHFMMNEELPSGSSEAVVRSYSPGGGRRAETFARLNAWNQPIDADVNINMITSPVNAITNRNLNFSLANEVKGLIKNMDQEERKAEGKNALAAILAHFNLEERCPGFITTGGKAMSPHAYSTLHSAEVRRLKPFFESLNKENTAYNKALGRAIANGGFFNEPLTPVEVQELIDEHFTDQREIAKKIIDMGKKAGVIPQDIANMRDLIAEKFVNPEFSVAEHSNDPNLLFKKLREFHESGLDSKALPQYLAGDLLGDDVVDALANYKTGRRAEIANSQRRMLTPEFRPDKQDTVTVGYDAAKAVLNKELKSYLKAIGNRDDLAVRQLRRAMKEGSPFSPTLYGIMQEIIKHSGVKARVFRTPKLHSAASTVFNLEVSPNSMLPETMDASGTFFSNGHETQQYRVPYRWFFQANADNDGDEVAVAGSRGNTNADLIRKSFDKKYQTIEALTKEIEKDAVSNEVVGREPEVSKDFDDEVRLHEINLDALRNVAYALVKSGKFTDPEKAEWLREGIREDTANSKWLRMTGTDGAYTLSGGRVTLSGLGELISSDYYFNKSGQFQEDMKNLGDKLQVGARGEGILLPPSVDPGFIRGADRGADTKKGVYRTAAHEIYNNRNAETFDDLMLPAEAWKDPATVDTLRKAVIGQRELVLEELKTDQRFAHLEDIKLSDTLDGKGRTLSRRKDSAKRSLERLDKSNDPLARALKVAVEYETVNRFTDKLLTLSEQISDSEGGLSNAANSLNTQLLGPFKMMQNLRNGWVDAPEPDENDVIHLNTTRFNNYKDLASMAVAISREAPRDIYGGGGIVQIQPFFRSLGGVPEDVAKMYDEAGSDVTPMVILARMLSNRGFTVMMSPIKKLPFKERSGGTGEMSFRDARKASLKEHFKHFSKKVAASEGANAIPNALRATFEHYPSGRTWMRNHQSVVHGILELDAGSYGTQEKSRLLEGAASNKRNHNNKVAIPAEKHNRVSYPTGTI